MIRRMPRDDQSSRPEARGSRSTERKPAAELAKAVPEAEVGLAGVLAVPDFLRVWVAGICVGTMRWLEILAVGLYTLQETGSAFMVALMYFARTGPTLICGPLAGALAERVPRRKLYLTGLLVMMFVSAGLCLLAYTGALQLWHVACGAVLSGIIWSLEHTTRRTIARDVVPPTAVGNAISLDTGSQNATRMLGPLVGGTLMAVIGIQGAYALSAMFFTVAALLIVTLGGAFPPASPGGASMLRGLLDVVRHAARNPNLSAVLAVTIVMNLLGFPYISMVPVIAREVIGLDASATGVLMSAEGAGAIFGAVTLALGVQRRHYARIFIGGSALFMICIHGFSHLESFAAGAAVLFVAGLGLGAFAAMQSTILLTFAPPHMRARVMGLLVVAIGAGPLGVLGLGSLAEAIGASSALAISSGIGLALLCATMWRWPVLVQPTEDPPAD